MKNKSVPTSLAAGMPTRKKKSDAIGYVGGRSGGHIVPALTHARNHMAHYPDDQILFIPTDTPLDVAIVGAADHVHTKLYLKLPNVPRGVFALPLFAWRFGVSFLQSFR